MLATYLNLLYIQYICESNDYVQCVILLQKAKICKTSTRYREKCTPKPSLKETLNKIDNKAFRIHNCLLF